MLEKDDGKIKAPVQTPLHPKKKIGKNWKKKQNKQTKKIKKEIEDETRILGH